MSITESYSQIVDIQLFKVDKACRHVAYYPQFFERTGYLLRQPQDNPGQPGKCQVYRTNLAPHKTRVE